MASVLMRGFYKRFGNLKFIEIFDLFIVDG
jgi:hypothetical protein